MRIEQLEIFGECYGASVAESFKTDNSDADALPKCGDADEYLQFLKKFELKKTTDDCYTPPAVYDTVADYVSGRWGIPRKNFVRPFFPGGDFENFDYKDGCVVMDNPPFSIFSKTVKFYTEHKIPFFIFGPHLTIFNALNDETTAILCCAKVIYDNGAIVATSFMTNLPSDNAVEVLPELKYRIESAQESTNNKKNKRKLSFPSFVVNSARIGKYANYGIKVELKKNGCRRIKSFGNTDIFGGGLLLDKANAAAIERANAAAIERANAAANANANANAAIEIRPTAQDEAMMKEMGW